MLIPLSFFPILEGQEGATNCGYLGVTIVAPTRWELLKRGLDGGNHKHSFKTN
jgi:hypothetical protein